MPITAMSVQRLFIYDEYQTASEFNKINLQFRLRRNRAIFNSDKYLLKLMKLYFKTKTAVTKVIIYFDTIYLLSFTLIFNNVIY